MSTGSANAGRPRDGPATHFEADPLVSELVSLSDAADASSKEGQHFGLVLVAGWPPNLAAIEDDYDEFLSLIRKCFDEEDIGIESPSVYLYPVHCLHVTVATLHSIAQNTRSLDEQKLLLNHWKNIVTEASEESEWPTTPFKISIKRAQIGKRAGILLWNEDTGGLDRMRACISKKAKEHDEILKDAGIFIDTLSIPPIIHSTFLRFHQTPKTNGEAIQSRFMENVETRLKPIFSSPLELKDAKLVCERTPYMHIPNDERHVLATFPLEE